MPGHVAGLDERLGPLEGGLPDTADDGQAEAHRRLAGQRVETDHLEAARGQLRGRRLGQAFLPRLIPPEEAALRDVAAKPEPPAVEHQRRWAVEDDALGEAFVVLQQQDHALVEVLLPQSEAKLLLSAAQDDRALLDERRRIHEAALGSRARTTAVAVAAAALGLLRRHEPGAKRTPVLVVQLRRVFLAQTKAPLRRAAVRAPPRSRAATDEGCRAQATRDVGCTQDEGKGQEHFTSVGRHQAAVLSQPRGHNKTTTRGRKTYW